MKIVFDDICKSDCEAIVNASNGIGFMGGKAGIRKQRPGVAEAIHFVTHGEVEQAAKKVCKEHSIFGFAPGNVFVTPAFNLNSNYIIHAVTMRFPGTYSSLNTVRVLLPKILERARILGVKSIAIPLLGTGTGHIDTNKVMNLYHEVFDPVTDLEITVFRK